MPRLVNWELMGNPLNWVIVILMLGIGAMALFALQPALEQWNPVARVA
jgi:hypothetical protein